LDDHTRDLYERSCRRLAELGYVLAPIDLASFLAAGALLYDGPLVAERHVAVGDALSHVQGADPTVATIILGATRWTAADAYAAEYRLTELRHACRSVFEQVDAIALPTAGCIATLADVAADPVGANARLGRLTTFANLLDLACVAVPMGMRTDGIPSGLQLIGAAWSDDVLAVAAASFVGEDAPSPTLPAPEDVPLVVVGAHLRGQPLNGQLTERGARFVRSTTTSAEYRLYAMAATTPAKPALVRSEVGGAPIAVEVWMMPLDQLGSFLAIVPPPLCLGTVELSDGSWQKGFLCEPRATDGAVEITEHGGWIAYRSTLG
jgi:allophanate hydrolase